MKDYCDSDCMNAACFKHRQCVEVEDYFNGVVEWKDYSKDCEKYVPDPRREALDELTKQGQDWGDYDPPKAAQRRG